MDKTLYNHLALPDKLPQSEDCPDEIENNLIDRFLVGARQMHQLSTPHSTAAWEAIQRCLTAAKVVHCRGRLDRSRLLTQLRAFTECRERHDFLVFHIRSQNAALLIHRLIGSSNEIVVEVFETSPRNEDILAASTALQWDFPGSAVAIPLATFNEEDFQSNLATFLEQASLEYTKTFAAHTFKAGTEIHECRDTPAPTMISSMLMAMLEESGCKISTPLLRKRVRDDICWKGAKKPWRRLPFWLVLRVATARYLSLALGGDLGRFEYKFFLCVCFANFLDSTHSTLDVEQTHFLKSKLCRRLVKLDVDRASVQDQDLAQKVDFLFEQLIPGIDGIINEAALHVQLEWKNFKVVSTKHVPPLPKTASLGDMTLPLRVSGEALLAMQTMVRRPTQPNRTRPLDNNLSAATNEEFPKYAEPYLRAAEQDEIAYQLLWDSQHKDASGFVEVKLSKQIEAYIVKGLPLYQENTEQMSTLILNTMELWMRLDELACQAYPLLHDYHPVFTPELLNAIHLSGYAEMARLQEVQRYLQRRIAASDRSRTNVFDDPSKACFARRYYDECSEAKSMHDLHDAVETNARRLKETKLKEWQQKKGELEKLAKLISETTCMFMVDENNPLRQGSHNPARCARCKMERRMSNMRMQIYEHPLPSDNEFMAKVVVFELLCPRNFSIYRDTTWMIICRLGLTPQAPGTMPTCLLNRYAPLSEFAKNAPSSLTLASVRKPFSMTHYSVVQFPVEWEEVCKPNGLRFSYFDVKNSFWTGRSRLSLTFVHHVQLKLPPDSLFQPLVDPKNFAVDGDGQTSYKIQASQMNCPSGLSRHEFLAFQTLLSGFARRWLSILVEFSSNNLNFSTEATMILLNHLALQCGPASGQDDPLRLVHSAFRDRHFVEKLLEQVEFRLATLAANWREAHLMKIIVTLALRVHNLTNAAGLQGLSQRSLKAIMKAREICRGWFRILRTEIQESHDESVAERLQRNALAAALLCKRTFIIHIGRQTPLDSLALETYIESTIVVQESLASNIQSLPQTLSHDLVFAIKLSHQLREVTLSSLIECQEGLRRALVQFWPGADRMESESVSITLEQPGWVRCRIPETDTHSEEVVYFNFLLGNLLVNGKPVGRLPRDSKNSVLLGELFGDQPLRVFRSSVPGMTYTLTYRPNGYNVHVGYEARSKQMIVLATTRGQRIRLVLRDTFYAGEIWDLPTPLVDGCFHWLDLDKGEVYITPSTNPWQLGRRCWTLNIRNRTCRKERPDKTFDQVVNPLSPLFQRVGRILEGLTSRRQLLVYQPSKLRTGLEVRIQRMQLMFFVNGKQLLYSPQLGLEVDPNQDAGTWYGLKNKLVCRKANNPLRRKVLVPLGSLQALRSGCHVSVQVSESCDYGKFDINDILGRIECAAEPRLVYTKAILHAYTSFVIPDPLTGRTGVEESLQWLQSGICRPWNVIGHQVQILDQIAELTPSREYYPPDKKVMKTDHWNRNLTCHIQHPSYRIIVQEIMSISDELETFDIATPSTPEQTTREIQGVGNAILNDRALVRRQLYERISADDDGTRRAADCLYNARDKSSPSERPYRRVMEMVHLLRTCPETLKTPENLASILSQGGVIGGYGDDYDKVSLSDRMQADIRENWGSLVQFCRNKSRYSVIFLFAALAYRTEVDDGLLRAVIAFATFHDLKCLPLPQWPSYSNFRQYSSPQLGAISKMIQLHKTPPPKDDRENLEHFASAKQRRRLQADREAYEMKTEDDSRYLAKFLIDQWPCREPDTSQLVRHLLIDVPAAMDTIQPEWLRLYQNMELSIHLQKVQQILDQHRTDVEYVPPQIVVSEEILHQRLRGMEVPGLGSQLLRKSVNDRPLVHSMGVLGTNSQSGWMPLASISKDQPTQSRANRQAVISNARPQVSPAEKERHLDELQQIAKELGKSKSLVRQTYSRDLLQSLEAFENIRIPQDLSKPFLFIRKTLTSKQNVICTFEIIKAALEDAAPDLPIRRIRWLQLGGLWPAVTTVVLLERLRSTASPRFGSGMREALIAFGLALTNLQRDMRLNDCVLAGDTTRFQDEEANIGHSNWSPEDQPDWLLLEIESNLLIRPDQVDVARATICPESGANSVLQMNMGQGKTSCIIPMVAASMADKKSLVRVIVPKALLLQTAQLLQSRLGGILNRSVRHIPFSRRTGMAQKNIRLYFGIHLHILKTAGVMVCLPEHNLSFILSGQQKLLDGKVNEAEHMIKVQTWLKSVCRDILDESDYTLAARTQLIYPSGSQMSVDGHPHRWQVIETVLSLVDRHLYGLASSFPRSIEVVRRPGGGFPLIFFLRPDVEEELVHRLVLDITKGFGDLVPMNSLDSRERAAVKDFLSPGKRKLRIDTVNRVQNLCPDRPWRWNVQYGLHPKRDPMAVPFHAKGVPSEQSEWGHPDVAILFTCLVFYYDGITEGQLKQALGRVLKSDDPSSEYDKWTQISEEFPESLKAWNTINVDDQAQMHEIWKALRYRVVVIDYFLNNFVFPRHAKQFKVKLQSNGWDIPLFSACSGEGGSKAGLKPLTTGFSGTNDNRTMLPLTIKQEDLPGLSHTNAEVLTYLLHGRSRRCEVITDVRGGRATERDLLHMLKKMDIRILIDAGAQILEMDNETVARTWLKIDQRCEAALYFDSANKPFIITKKSRKTPLLASPFADDLTKCLVYLDEAHTRGTDLKFPLQARGALTVGQGQSKDHTVQAAMRLRQLGTSQSITFLIPTEVHQVIVDLRRKTMNDRIDSYDVICWLLNNACDGIEQLQPLYFSQGSDFCRRTQAAINNPDFLTDSGQRSKYVAAIKQNELQTLQDLYEPKLKTKANDLMATNPKVAEFIHELNVRRKGFQDTGRAVHASALQEVEQEREVTYEVQSVRQVKKPFKCEALTFPGFHRDLETFTRTGRLPIDTNSYYHVFQLLSRTALGRKHSVSRDASKSKLYVSVEFERTAKLYTDLAKDNFLRPVSWILWSGVTETAVVLIPEEAECVIRMNRAAEMNSRVYLINYASPVTKKMLVFNNLTYFSTPRLPDGWVAPLWLKMEVGLLSGRLFFEWDEYEKLGNFFGLEDKSNAAPVDEDEDSSDDTVLLQEQEISAATKRRRQANSFASQPSSFLKEWLAVRRCGQDFAHTPMGFLTQGKPLQPSHPFFSKASPEAALAAAEDGKATATAKSEWGVGEVHGGGDHEAELFDDGIDDMGANVEDDVDEGGVPVVYDDDEYPGSENDDSMTAREST
ncbi:hypothetical protein B0T26DRAFT_784054 [Lasiosphaeria miniovina]|uniref:ubiquitinyl hydrolase 1 n=1 Tax=Lasiosphaeria miniovina TaxID=1954250 RepID=A0AA40AE02_9PEZI|nr:uncharacterized protein B0T26DRAFT_784054 [Lasiosphaeria miniovina]KAK0714105.1 hypothetical protein B0T26DRAFT_784054 [Lasiosphaeria miniovina]